MSEKIKVVELCSGVGMQLRGLEDSTCFEPEVMATSEIDINAIIAYASIHCGLTPDLVNEYQDYPSMDEMRQYLKDLNIGYSPEKDKVYNWDKGGKKFEQQIKTTWLACQLSKNLGDISKIETVPEADLWFISSPCFVEGTLVFTNGGYKPIEEIEVGDYVLTHNGKFEKVTEVMTNEADSLIKIHCMVSDDVHCTPNHPFYVRKKHVDTSEFEEPQWIEAKDLNEDYYLGTAINQKELIPHWDGIVDNNGKKRNRIAEVIDKEVFWRIIGRFIGNGWVKSNGGIIISTNESELQDLLSDFDEIGWSYIVQKEGTVNKVYIISKEMGTFCSQFGRGMTNRHLTEDVLNLPVNLLKAFLEGDMATEGSVTNQAYKVSSPSKRLLYDISACVHKVYHTPTFVYCHDMSASAEVARGGVR